MAPATAPPPAGSWAGTQPPCSRNCIFRLLPEGKHHDHRALPPACMAPPTCPPVARPNAAPRQPRLARSRSALVPRNDFSRKCLSIGRRRLLKAAISLGGLQQPRERVLRPGLAASRAELHRPLAKADPGLTSARAMQTSPARAGASSRASSRACSQCPSCCSSSSAASGQELASSSSWARSMSPPSRAITRPPSRSGSRMLQSGSNSAAAASSPVAAPAGCA